ncbi:hypothetical protein F2Q69_00004173 [Brassica cretica]|uniref:Photosystem II cytochrome b559 N-terminal domain-containing protein n=1 Tax=Brassica cretica TaxID=69181 RepID=A0A8S9PID1_BRACR|nr:hypothetical protein F2Q69_00004173 [Brassica cretica]
MTIDRTYPIFTVRWLAVHGLAVPTTEKLLLIARNEKQKYSDKDVLQYCQGCSTICSSGPSISY